MRILTGLPLALALASCSGPFPGSFGTSGMGWQTNGLNSAGMETATIRIETRFISPTRGLQAVISPWTQGSIDHLDIRLDKRDASGTFQTALDGSGNAIGRTILKANLSDPLLVARLRPSTTYRIRAMAYKAAGSATDDLISVNASSSVIVNVTSDDRPTLAELPVVLADRSFSGEATGSLSVVSGNVVNQASESLVIP